MAEQGSGIFSLSNGEVRLWIGARNGSYLSKGGNKF